MTHHKCGAGGLSEGAEQVRAHAGDVTNIVTDVVCSQKQTLLLSCPPMQFSPLTVLTSADAVSCAPPAMTAGLRGSSSGMSFSI